jgi:glyoxylase-like metal-dependent hydrolase (beta-lactamase superfamily II)
MRSWKIGAVTVSQVVEHVLSEGLEGVIPEASCAALQAIDWLCPEFVTKDGRPIYSFHALIVDTPAARIVIDTCVGNDKDLPILAAWDHMQSDFLAKFEAAGFTRESVDYVVCTHLHFDHIGWNTMRVNSQWIPTFPNARYLLGRREYEHSLAEGAAPQTEEHWRTAVLTARRESLAPVIAAGLVDFVEFEHRICSEVRLVPTVGHTPGHVSVEIASEGAHALVTGDSIHHPCQLARPSWSTISDTDSAQAALTRERLLSQAAGTPQLLIGTHWAGVGAGHIVRDGPTYRLLF